MNDDNTVYAAPSKKIKFSGLTLNKGVLIILSGKNGFGSSWVIRDRETVIGRSRDCTISVADPKISNKHCSINLNDKDEFCIRDLGSTNGTFLNNSRLKKDKTLFYGDRIVIGETIFRFYMAETLNSK